MGYRVIILIKDIVIEFSNKKKLDSWLDSPPDILNIRGITPVANSKGKIVRWVVRYQKVF